MTPEALARACADAMWSSDHASQGLGMAIESIAPGQSVLTMIVRRDMINGHGICHGGFIFALSDSAFAFACNTYNQCVVAQMAQIGFLAPAFEGERLTATAREIWRQGRSGVYDIRVTNQTGAPVAEFRGHSRIVKGTHLPEE